MTMKPLSERSREELEQAMDHINEIEAWAGEQSRAAPGPGWAPVFEMLMRDWNELEAELAKRPDVEAQE